MRTEQLRYLDSVLRNGSFRGAARELGISQPTISQQIQRLEEELDLVLVTRARGRVMPTAEAEPLLPLVDRLLQDERVLREEASAIKGLRTGSVRLGCIATISRSVLAEALPAYRRRYPNIRFDVRETGSLPIIEQVLSGSLDLGLISGMAEDPVIPDLSYTRLFPDPLVLCVPRGHPLTSRTRVGIADAAREPWILYDANYALRRYFDQRTEGTTLNVVYQTNSTVSAIHLVAAGLGVALVGTLGITTSDTADQAKVRGIPLDAPPTVLSMIARADSRPPPAVRELRRMLHASAARIAQQIGGSAAD